MVALNAQQRTYHAQVAIATFSHVSVATHTYKKPDSYASWPAVPAAVADAGTATQVAILPFNCV